MPGIEHEGREYFLGARPRLGGFDPNEVKYRLAVPPTVDLNQSYSLAQYRTRVEDQGQIGACVAHACTTAAEMLAVAAGLQPPNLDRLWTYARTRQVEGTFPRDDGSNAADALDLALASHFGGYPRESLEPRGYVADAAFDPPHTIDADAPGQPYVTAHHPIYAKDAGGFRAGIAAALSLGMPCVVGMAWRNEFFNPPGGVLPVLPPDQAAIVGGHEIVIWGYQPLGGTRWRAWCQNSWGAGWPSGLDGSQFPALRSGDFAIPGELFENGMVWDVRAVAGPAHQPQPTPPPGPQPNPQPTPADYQRGIADERAAVLATVQEWHDNYAAWAASNVRPARTPLYQFAAAVLSALGQTLGQVTPGRTRKGRHPQ